MPSANVGAGVWRSRRMPCNGFEPGVCRGGAGVCRAMGWYSAYAVEEPAYAEQLYGARRLPWKGRSRRLVVRAPAFTADLPAPAVLAHTPNNKKHTHKKMSSRRDSAS